MASEPLGFTFSDRMIRALAVLLAIGNLVWFVMTFPIYFRWAYQVGIAGLPVYLLWLFVGLPSLLCAIVALRRSATQGGAGILLKLAFLLTLGICVSVVGLVSIARWSVDAETERHFPWITLLVTAAAGLVLAIYALRGTGKVARPSVSTPDAPATLENN